MKYAIHKDFRLAKFVKLPMYKFMLPVANLFLSCMKKSSKTIKVTKISNMPCLAYEFANSQGATNAIVYFHGGGFVVEAGPNHYRMIGEYVKRANCKVIFIKYPLATNHSLDKTLDVCYQSYKLIVKNKKALNIETLGVAGDSAGGFISAYVTKKAQIDNIEPQFQMLIYPVIDCKMRSESCEKYTNTPFWNALQNRKMWKWCLPKESDDLNLLDLDAVKNINTYIETAEFDPLHDEGKMYAKKLEKENQVIYNDTKGTIHGYDFFIKSSIVLKNINKRVAFLLEQFK